MIWKGGPCASVEMVVRASLHVSCLLTSKIERADAELADPDRGGRDFPHAMAKTPVYGQHSFGRSLERYLAIPACIF